MIIILLLFVVLSCVKVVNYDKPHNAVMWFITLIVHNPTLRIRGDNNAYDNHVLILIFIGYITIS